MKKILAWLLVLVMVLGLCSCDKTRKDNNEQEESQSNKEFVAAYTSEYPYLQLIILDSMSSTTFDCVRCVAASGEAYRPPYWESETEPESLGNNVVGLTEAYVLYADGTVTLHATNSKPYDKDLTNVVEIEQGDVNNGTDWIALHSDGTISVFDRYNDTTKFHHAREWTDIIAISVTNSHLVGLKSDGTVIATGGNDDGQCNVEGWRDIIAISTAEPEIGRVCGVTYGLRKDGTVISTEEGFNTSSWTDIVAIAATQNFVMGLKADGTVMVVGDDYYGETKISDWTDIVAIKAYPGLSIGIKADGTVVSAGDDYVITKYLKDIKLKVK